MRFAGVIAFWGAVLGVGGCSLFVSLDGLSDGTDASTSGDAANGSDAPSDALSSDSGNKNDATATDASTGADANFLDDFNRPNSTSIGNDWMEKTPAAFSLSNDAVLRGAFGTFNYADGLAYRPPGEDLEDCQISIEVAFAADAGGYPQIHARVQEDTVAQAGNLDSYLLYLSSATMATVSRTRGATNLSDLSSATLTEPLVASERYRLTLRVSGKLPVSIFGTVEHFESGAWTLIGQASALDTDPTQLDDAGTVGFSSTTDDVDHYSYDNFTRTPM